MLVFDDIFANEGENTNEN